ncbi:Acyl transferase/acyl hydrolase/lysophospholipase [Rhypophila decipiens]
MSRDLIAFQTNERRSPVPETPRTDDHNYRYHRYLLSLDGGGVRGLSTLLILKNIMHQVNAKRRERGFTCDLKPCDVFDLIGGTSTGGLIAIMLGRLEMDVDSCLETYREFIPQVFSKPSTFPITWSGNLRPRYSSKTLRETVIHIIGRRVGTSNEKDPSEVFLREDVPGTRSNPEHMCRVFVCATPAEHVTTTSRLRGYHVSFEGESFRPTIVQAALATTAAPTFFAPLKVPLSGSGSRSYVDGALHANNPIQVVEREAQDVFLGVQSETNPLTPYFTPYFLSIGTGILHKPESGSTGAKLLEALSKIATETETTAKNFRNHIRMDKKDWGYHRFNVEQGLQDMKMDEIDKNPEGRIEAVTEDYLRDDVIRDSICGCVNVLANKEHHPSSIGVY